MQGGGKWRDTLHVNRLELVQHIWMIGIEERENTHIRFMKYLQPAQKPGRSRRGHIVLSPCSPGQGFPVWIIPPISKGAAAVMLRPEPAKFGKCEKVCWPWNELGDFICGNWSHSPSFTSGGHGYSRLCWLVAIKDIKEGAVNTLALRLTTWPPDAPLVESGNRKWTKDYSDRNQSGDKKKGGGFTLEDISFCSVEREEYLALSEINARVVVFLIQLILTLGGTRLLLWRIQSLSVISRSWKGQRWQGINNNRAKELWLERHL